MRAHKDTHVIRKIQSQSNIYSIVSSFFVQCSKQSWLKFFLLSMFHMQKKIYRFLLGCFVLIAAYRIVRDIERMITRRHVRI